MYLIVYYTYRIPVYQYMNKIPRRRSNVVSNQYACAVAYNNNVDNTTANAIIITVF